jgi:hypothetical protein
MWNYRIVKTTDEVTKEDSFELCEVNYDNLGKPMGYCPVSVIGDSVWEIIDTIRQMAEASARPVLTFSKPKNK